MARWIQCPETNKLIPAEEYDRHIESTFSVRGDLKPFVSPVDGKPIYSHASLRDHNKKHGVTDPRDYGENWFNRKKKERDQELTGTTKKQKAQRIDDIQRAIYHHKGG